MRAKKSDSRPRHWSFPLGPNTVAALVLAGIGLAVYANSFSCPLIFDGREFIADHPPVNQFWPPWAPLVESNRPVGFLSFAVNYALHGTEVWGYHAVNVAIHVAAAWALFAIVRHTLTHTRRIPDRYGNAAWGLALAVALVWLAHPLQTQSVTYIYQRLESLMGLFYLLTLYLFIRGVNAPQPGWWYAGSVACCTLGMGTKEVMVTAPLAVLWYDRALVSHSWREIVEKRIGYYAALFGTWVVLALIMVGQWARYPGGGVLVVEDLSPVDYALTQPAVILHYLRLSIWPTGLCLDYDWPVARTAAEIVPPLVAIGALLIGTIWCAVYRPAWGLVAGLFFLILAPTSSIAPIKDLAFEHRMYLPLAAVIVLIVVGGYDLWRIWVVELSKSGQKPWAQIVPAAALVGIVVLAGYQTRLRNLDYESAFTIWKDTALKQPGNARAWYSLGHACQESGENDRAVVYYTKAVELNPRYAEAYNNRGYARGQFRQYTAAIDDLTKAIRYKADYAQAYNNRGNAHYGLRQHQLAMDDYAAAIRIDPDYAEAYNNRANIYYGLRRYDLAIRDYTSAIDRMPWMVEAYANRGTALEKLGQLEPALHDYTRAIELKPAQVIAYQKRAMLYYKMKQYDRARADAEQVLKRGGKLRREFLDALAAGPS